MPWTGSKVWGYHCLSYLHINTKVLLTCKVYSYLVLASLLPFQTFSSAACSPCQVVTPGLKWGHGPTIGTAQGLSHLWIRRLKLLSLIHCLLKYKKFLPLVLVNFWKLVWNLNMLKQYFLLHCFCRICHRQFQSAGIALRQVSSIM